MSIIEIDDSEDRKDRLLRLAKAVRRKHILEQQRIQSDLGEQGRSGGLIPFVRNFWHILEPATPFVEGWVVEAVAMHLEAVTRGEIKRLVINVPPGFMKPVHVDELVATDRGFVRLGDVVVGDKVLTHKGRYRAVTAVHEQGVIPVVRIKTLAGRSIVAAPDHPFLTPRGWVNAGDLTSSDDLAAPRENAEPNLHADQVVAVEPHGSGECRCLTVEEDSTFTVNGVIVHNSLLVNVYWPAWEWSAAGLPSTRYVTFSYAAHLTIRDNAKFRDLIRHVDFQEVWGHLVTLKKEGEIKPENENTGWKFASSVGGVGTGERGGRLLADDLHSVKSAESEPVRQETVRWVREGMSNRLNDMANDVIIGIGQRVHEEDASAAMLADPDYVHLCYDDKTEILTRNGWVPFPLLERGIDVMGVCPSTLKAKWEMPTNYVCHHYDGFLFHYLSTAIDLAVTPDHRMVYADTNDWKANKKTAWRVKAAKDLPRHFYVPQAVEWDGSANPVKYGGRVWDAANFADFMGWYLSEGCSNAKHCLTRIVQSDGPLCDEIEGVLAASPFDYTKLRHGRDGLSVFHIGSKSLAAELSALGKSHTKRVPQEVLGLSPALLQRFIVAFAKGDGCPAGRYGNGILITSRSKELIDGIQQCTVKAGWAANVRSRMSSAREFNGYTMPVGLMWDLYIRYSKSKDYDHKWYAKVRSVNVGAMAYSGNVYCVSVPSTAVVVRRNGRVSISGNCVPMQFDPGRKCRTKIGWEDPRTKEGELAWPERFPLAVVNKLKTTLGPYAFSAQYQQAPSPRGGGIIKSEWWQVWDEPTYPQCYYRWASADTAYTEKEENDPTGFTCWGLFEIAGQPQIIMMDAWRKRLELHIPARWTDERSPEHRLKLVQAWRKAAWAQKERAERDGTHVADPVIGPEIEPWASFVMHGVNTADRWPGETYEDWKLRTQDHWGLCEWLVHSCRRFSVNELIIEGKASGISVAQELRRLNGNEGWGIKLVTPEGDKVARAYAVQSIFSAGLVHAPQRAWAEMVIEEVSGFPKGRYKDLTDSTTMALKHIREIGLLVRPEERLLHDEMAARYVPQSKPLYPT